MTDPITILTGGFLGNITANALYDAGKWTLDKTRQWLTHQWFEPKSFEIIHKEIQKAFQKAWTDIASRYRDGGQWQRLSRDKQDLIQGRSQWLDRPDFQKRIFPQILSATELLAQTGKTNPVWLDRDTVNKELFQHLNQLGLIDGLPVDFEGLLHEYLLDGIVYHFIEDGIKRNEELRHVLFYQQLQILQHGQNVEQVQLEEVLAALEQLASFTRWQVDISQKLEQKLDEVKETIRDEARKVQEEVIAKFKDIVTPRLLQETRRIPPFLYLIDFLGREKELQEFATAWSQGIRAVLVYGLAGIGKSALVSQFLEKSAQVPGEDVFRNDFRLSPDFSSFARQLGIFLEMPAPPEETPEAYIFSLLASLRSRSCVLFFDNFEEALRPVPEVTPGVLHGRALKIKDPSLEKFLDQLLRTEHAARVIFTSRFRPDFGTANVYVQQVPHGELSGLPTADGRELLMRRKGDTSISPDEWLEVDRQLEGHPVALELFGQILQEGSFSVRELLTRVEKIEKANAQSPFMERLAEDMLDTLYVRLTDVERILLRRMSVMRLPFNPTACAILASITEMEAKAISDVLFRKCLFRRQDTLFHFHPLVQSYALNQLKIDASEPIESHLRAAEYYLMLDRLARPWQHENDTGTALEAFYHLQWFDEERAYDLLGEVATFLEQRGIAYYLQGSYADSEVTIRTRLLHLEKYKDRSDEDAQNYGRAQFHYANIVVKQHKSDNEALAAFQAATNYAPNHVPAWQAWAIMERDQGNIERARELFKKAVEVGPQHAPAWHAWAIMERDQENIEIARYLFENAVQANDRDPMTWQAWAVLERQQRNFERARELFKKAIAVGPRHVPAWQAWAIMERAQGNIEVARDLFAKAIEIDPHNAPAWRAWATMETEQRNTERARELFAKAVEVDPQHASAWQAWAIMESEQGNIERARELFEKAVDVNPQHAPAWQAWAVLERNEGNIVRARELFAKSTEVDPRHVYAWQAWAIMERDQDNIERAGELFAKTAEIEPQNVLVWQAWAIMESTQGDVQRARQLFEKAVALDPHNALVWQAWAIMERDQGDLERARDLFESAVQADDRDPITWQAWGVLESKAGRYEQALEFLERSYAIEPNDPLTLHSIAIVHLRLRHIDKARTFLEKALELDPGNFILWFSLGDVELRARNYPLAEAHLRMALQLAPSDARAWSMLGDVQHKTNRDEDAEASYNQSIALDGSPRTKSWTYWKKAELLKRKADRTSHAELAYRSALELEPDNPDYHLSLGEFLYWHRRYPEAEAEYKRTLELAPENYYAMVNLAGLLARMQGRDDEAESLFSQALQLQPTDWRVHAHYANFLTWRSRYDEAQPHYLRSLQIREDARVREQYNQMIRKKSLSMDDHHTV